jgi:hypothetical protein
MAGSLRTPCRDYRSRSRRSFGSPVDRSHRVLDSRPEIFSQELACYALFKRAHYPAALHLDENIAMCDILE